MNVYVRPFYTEPDPPPAGSVGVGELLIDVQTSRMWVGVSETLDPDQAILVNDYKGLLQSDADTLNSAKLYADNGLALKSNVGHKHPASDISDFDEAVDAAIAGAAGVPVGGIIIWKGSLSQIGIGALAGWALCDGTNGTPDLSEKFVMGPSKTGSKYKPGDTGGSASATGTTDPGGAHAHTGATENHTLTIAQMPYHNHTAGDSGHIHAASSPSHRHVTTAGGPATQGFGDTGGRVCAYANTYSDYADPGITIGYGYANIAVNNTGGGGAHQHIIKSEPAHTHTFSISGGGLPPYYVLAYIMKLP